MIVELVVLAAAATGYAVYKHVTVAQVKAEVVKAEAYAVTLEAAAKAEVLKVVAAVKAKL